MEQKKALVLGATGAVGSCLVRELLVSLSWGSVRILTRKPTQMFQGVADNGKLSQTILVWEHLEQEFQTMERGVDVAFSTMGIGQPRKVDRETLWKLEVDQTFAFAKACRDQGVRHFSLLTAVGAKEFSRFYYAHVKGSIERKIEALGFERCSFFQPSLLVTPGLRYGMQDRLTQWLVPKLTPFFPARFHEIRVEDLGRAMRLNAERLAASPVERLQYPQFAALLQ